MNSDNLRFEEQIHGINWESLSLQELLDIFDKLGVGFNMTLLILLKTLKPGQIQSLMNLVSALQIGKKETIKGVRNNYWQLKQNQAISKNVSHTLFVLLCRVEKKYGFTSFEDLPNQNFKPAFTQ
jgi:hypothetical protein